MVETDQATSAFSIAPPAKYCAETSTTAGAPSVTCIVPSACAETEYSGRRNS